MTSETATPIDDADIFVTDEASVDRASTRRWSGRDRLIGHGIVIAGFAAVLVSLKVNNAGLHESEIRSSWQLDSVDNLMANPFTSTWYRHVQPPLYNLYIGSVLR